MEKDRRTEKMGLNFVRRLCFIAIGISAFSDSMERLNPYNMMFGALAGLLFGCLFRKFLGSFLSLFNGKFKRENGKEPIRDAVDRGMLFLVPFAGMLLLAVYYLDWSETRGFVAAGIMAVGTAAAIELGKVKGKQEIRDILATSGIAFLFSFLWTLSYAYLAKAPSLLEGGFGLIRGFVSGGGIGL
ncbi:MAG: hypothetical protein KGZ50_02600 [Peptococcaceae bacterium]|nr:hypothetical protein [Peptococcaceae bacterium]